MMVEPSAPDDVQPMDVRFGRGARSNVNPGNRVYRRIVERRKVDFVRLKTKEERNILARSIVLAMNSQGSRFMKLNKDEDSAKWIEASMDESIAKTVETLRKFANVWVRSNNKKVVVSLTGKEEDYKAFRPNIFPQDDLTLLTQVSPLAVVERGLSNLNASSGYGATVRRQHPLSYPNQQLPLASLCCLNDCTAQEVSTAIIAAELIGVFDPNRIATTQEISCLAGVKLTQESQAHLSQLQIAASSPAPGRQTETHVTTQAEPVQGNQNAEHLCFDLNPLRMFAPTRAMPMVSEHDLTSNAKPHVDDGASTLIKALTRCSATIPEGPSDRLLEKPDGPLIQQLRAASSHLKFAYASNVGDEQGVVLGRSISSRAASMAAFMQKSPTGSPSFVSRQFRNTEAVCGATTDLDCPWDKSPYSRRLQSKGRADEVSSSEIGDQEVCSDPSGSRKTKLESGRDTNVLTILDPLFFLPGDDYHEINMHGHMLSQDGLPSATSNANSFF